MVKCDFSGWATRNDLLCGDGRVIKKDAFKHNDGKRVSLVWNHEHNDPDAVLGHAILENREEGVYAYGYFNDTPKGAHAKQLVQHGDVSALSIWANKLKHEGPNVIHGEIRELSLVLAGANPGAYIDFVMAHSADGEESIDELYANYNESIMLHHSEEGGEGEDESVMDIIDSLTDKQKAVVFGLIGEALDSTPEDDDEDDDEDEGENVAHSETEDKTVEDVLNTLSEEQRSMMRAITAAASSEGDDATDLDEEEVEQFIDSLNEDQKKVVYLLIGEAADGNLDTSEDDDTDDNSEGGNETMKHNVFEQNEVKDNAVLSHADQEMILATAKETGVGSLQKAIEIFKKDNESLAHGLDLGDTEVLEELLPDHKLLNPGAPSILRPDQSWVMSVINKIHKSPYARIRTRKADARTAELKAKGYKKGQEKKFSEHIKLLGRKTEPTTVYLKESLNRDDIVDITDFDVVNYVWNLMKDNMYETLALCALVGDGREDGDPDKISETNIRPIWKDEELYTIHKDVDIAAAKAELQGSNTSANFGENYIYAEAIITAALYAREKFKGSGTPTLYCAPHLVNVMLLARDLNGRRIYDSKADLARALNVAGIVEIEQLEGKTREDGEGNEKKLLGLFVNLADYQFGSTKGGEITKFDDFDIDFNKYKYLMETRLSGALTEPYSAIALEEPVVAG